jgi:hypothetical protein
MMLGMLLAVPAIAFAQDVTGSTPPVLPTIQSDKADYAPGELVTLTGSGWVPGESVNIVVNDDVGQSWNRNVNVTADASGNITDLFNLPNSFVAQYSVTATGAQSGTATTSFTDGNLGVRARIGSSSGTNLAVEFAAQKAKVFNSTNCTGTALASNANAFTTATNGQGYVPSTLSPTNANSASIEAPASVTSGSTTYTFSSWVADGPQGLGVTTTGTTGCFLRTTTQSNDPAWNVTAVYNVVTDTTAPTVSSITRAGSNPTNTTGNLSWTVTFSENVSGVDTGDFAPANSGLGGSPAIQSVTQGANASVYTVTASSGTGSGSLGLNLNDNDTIVDGANNKLGGTGTGTAGSGGTGNGSFTGEVYTIDRTAANVTLTDVNGAARSFPYSTNGDVTSVGGSCEPSGSPVHVTLGGNPTSPPLAPCSPSGSWTLNLITPLSSEATYLFAASQVDAVGNPGSSGNKSVTIDKTAPTVTLDKVNGTTRTFPYSTNGDVTSVGGSCTTSDGDVSVTLDGNATNPATASCSSGNWTLTLNSALSDEGEYTFSASQTDAAGNPGSSGNKSVTIDSTAPTVTATAVKGDSPGFTGATNYLANTWTNKDVRVTFTCADNTGGSGLTVGSAGQVKTFTTDTSGTTASFDGTCADKAGNTAADSDFGPIKIDKTAPTVTADADRDADHNGWYNAPFTVSFTGTDTGGSGIANCDADVNYNGPDTDGDSVSGSCTDEAGNSASDTYNFKYDNTDPSVTGTLARAADHNDWYNASVDYSFNGTDDTSGIDSASCTSGTYNGPDSATASVSGSCEDNAGNSASGTTGAFKFDDTDPTNVATTLNRAADHNGWYNASVNWTTDGDDATSGIDSCDSGTYDGPDGTGLTVSGECTDNAGNASGAAESATFKYDNTDPNANATASRPADHNSWYNAPFTVSFSGTDATSGPVSCDADVTYGDDNSETDGTGKSVSGSCTDEAGNGANATYNFKYDNTDPTISGTKSPGPNTFGWNNGSVTVSYSCNDPTSGVTSCGPNATLSSEGANQSSTGNATDEAGNTASTTVSGINIDKTAPTAIAFQGGSLNDGGSYDFNSVPSGPTGCSADGAISGLDGSCTVGGYGTGVGPHTVTATAKDKAGNTSTKTLSYTVKAANAYGFYQPVDMGGTLNTVKSGSTVPVKFELIGGSSNIEQKSTNAVGSISASKVNCAAFNGDPVDAIEYLAPTSENTGLRFDTTGDQFIYNWKTPAKAANTCYNLTMTAADNTTKLVAYFKLT